MDIAGYVLDKLKAAGHPVVNVTLPVLTNKGTWILHFAPEATADQQTAARAFVAALAVDAGAVADADADARLDQDKMLKALALWTAQAFGVPPVTMRKQVLAIYKGLP